MLFNNKPDELKFLYKQVAEKKSIHEKYYNAACEEMKKILG